MRERIWKHYEAKSEGAPSEADKPGEEASGMFAPVFVFDKELHQEYANCCRCQGRGVSYEVLC